LFADAQDTTISLWPVRKVPGYQNNGETERIDKGEFIRISKVQSPDIVVYLPSKKRATGQAVIICPGGGYTFLAYDWEGTDAAKFLNAKGIAAIVLKYRLPNARNNRSAHTVPLLDAQRALRTVRFYAEKWNIKKNQVGIMGFSAGGHLASTVATHFNEEKRLSMDTIDRQSDRPDFAILIYPVISMNPKITHTGSRNNLIGENPDSLLVKQYSNQLQVTNQTPPTFLLHATDDKTVPVENTLLFYQALKDHNIPVEMHIYPKGGHGFSLGLGYQGLEKWPELLLVWLHNLNK
jgi:acetyl esterase/lipase